MPRAFRILIIVALTALVAVPTAGAAKRMKIGFFDDRSFGLVDPALADSLLTDAKNDGATIIRTLADWSKIAATKPASQKNPNDPAYDFSQLDGIVKRAAARDVDVLISIIFTPAWANGGKEPQFPPKKARTLKNFARAIGTRYSGKFGGLPAVEDWTCGNEVNTSRFLSPQYKKGGRKAVGPRLYVRKIFLPCSAGIRKAIPKAKIAIGPLSPRGRKKNRSKGLGQAFPATFMQQVARECRGKCKFSAVAHHPYNFPGGKKGAKGKLKWPAIGLTSTKRYAKSLQGWFGLRKKPAMWITEYGFPTTPPFPGPPNGPTERKQGVFLKDSVKMVKKMGFVKMYVWFIYRDDDGAPSTTVWQASGGVRKTDGSDKPARSAFQRIAKTVKRPK